jgi:hypothetical protein
MRGANTLCRRTSNQAERASLMSSRDINSTRSLTGLCVIAVFETRVLLSSYLVLNIQSEQWLVQIQLQWPWKRGKLATPPN